MVAAVVLVTLSCGGGPAAVTTPAPSQPTVTFTPFVPPSPQPEQRREASLPVAVEETAAAAAGGKLYVMGGFNAAGQSLDSVFVFDGSTWSAGPRLQLPLPSVGRRPRRRGLHRGRTQLRARQRATLSPGWLALD